MISALSVLPARPLVSLSGIWAEESRQIPGVSGIVGKFSESGASLYGEDGHRFPRATTLARSCRTFPRGGHFRRSGGNGGTTSGANVGGTSATDGGPGISGTPD